MGNYPARKMPIESYAYSFACNGPPNSQVFVRHNSINVVNANKITLTPESVAAMEKIKTLQRQRDQCCHGLHRSRLTARR
jgi:hypothetical protein